MCMNTQEVFISNKIYKKACTFLKMVLQKLLSLQNEMKKLFEKHLFRKNCLQVPKIVTPR